ncbi:MAG: FHA domain-containing protein [Pirellulales bacterium]
MNVTVELPSGRRLAVGRKPSTIGRGADCELPIDDPTIAVRHAVLRPVGNRWMIEACGESFLQVGSKPPGRTFWLLAGDIIRLGEGGPCAVFDPPPLPAGKSAMVEATPAVPSVPRETAAKAAPVPIALAHAGPRVEKPTELARGRPMAASPLAAWSIANGSANQTWPWIIALTGTMLVAVVGVAVALRFGGHAAVSEAPKVDAPNAATPSATPLPPEPSLPPRDPSSSPGPDTTDVPPGSTAPSPPPPKPKPPPKPTISLDEAVRKAEPSVVWIAWGTSANTRLPFATGVAVGPRSVVTSATKVAALRELSEDGDAFVFYPALGEPFVAVAGMKLHSGFDLEDQGSSDSQRHNLGLLTVDRDLPHWCPLVAKADLHGIPTWEVAALAFSTGQKAAYSELSSPTLSSTSGKVIDLDPSPTDPRAIPRLVLDLMLPDLSAEGILIGLDGQMIGFVFKRGKYSVAIPAPLIQELLP